MEKATSEIDTFRKKENEFLLDIAAGKRQTSRLEAEIAEQAVNVERVNEVEAELEGWKMRTSSLQRRLSEMENDMLEERRAAARAMLEMHSTRNAHEDVFQPNQKDSINMPEQGNNSSRKRSGHIEGFREAEQQWECSSRSLPEKNPRRICRRW